MEEGKRMKRYRQKVPARQPNIAQVHGGMQDAPLDVLVRATNHPRSQIPCGPRACEECPRRAGAASPTAGTVHAGLDSIPGSRQRCGPAALGRIAFAFWCQIFGGVPLY